MKTGADTHVAFKEMIIECRGEDEVDVAMMNTPKVDLCV